MIDTYQEGVQLLREEFSAIPREAIERMYRREILRRISTIDYVYTYEELRSLVVPILEPAADAVRSRMTERES